jgi:hypothetical protein
MADATPPTSETLPGYFYHPTLPMVLCENEAEKDALPPGYRATPYTENEADAWTKAQASVQAKADDDDPPGRRSHR